MVPRPGHGSQPGDRRGGLDLAASAFARRSLPSTLNCLLGTYVHAYHTEQAHCNLQCISPSRRPSHPHKATPSAGNPRRLIRSLFKRSIPPMAPCMAHAPCRLQESRMWTHQRSLRELQLASCHMVPVSQTPIVLVVDGGAASKWSYW